MHDAVNERGDRVDSQGNQVRAELAPDLETGKPPQPDLPQPDLKDLGSEVSSGSRLISKILSPAIRLWLRVQLETAESLSFQVAGSDRQILQGYIPSVEVAARQAVYRGLHLGQAQLAASQIRINLGQVLQGKPLRLLEPVPVVGQVWISQTDLTASLASPLLRQALQEVWQLLFQQVEDERFNPLRSSSEAVELQAAQILLAPGRLTLTSEMIRAGQGWHLWLQTTPRLLTPACLELANLQMQARPVEQSSPSSQPFAVAPLKLDLGQDVHLEQLVIEAAQIVCQGRIAVNP